MTSEQVLQFWFGKDWHTDPLKNSDQWFKKEAEFDQKISDQFKDLLPKIEKEQLEDWKQTPEGTLAFIILTDQFPRSIFRGQRASFAFDPYALKASKQGVQKEFDKKLPWIGRIFFYLPFEHSESIADQEQSVSLFEILLQETPPKYNDYMAEAFEYAARHWDVIKRFGRFPHRNAILKRASTPEELNFLKLPNSTF